MVKCRRNHPNADVVICEFNSSHHIPLSEEEYHLQTCPDRNELVEKMKNELRLEDKKPAPFKPDGRVGDDEEEDWEREANIKTSHQSIQSILKCMLKLLFGVNPDHFLTNFFKKGRMQTKYEKKS